LLDILCIKSHNTQLQCTVPYMQITYHYRLYFPAYAAAKRWLSSGETSSKPQAHHLLIAGAMAGIPAASLTTPADVIKVMV
jgi:hypothetical protein